VASIDEGSETDDEQSINTPSAKQYADPNSQSFTELSRIMERRLEEASKLMSIRYVT
jgi:hypothetical protein